MRMDDAEVYCTHKGEVLRRSWNPHSNTPNTLELKGSLKNDLTLFAVTREMCSVEQVIYPYGALIS